MTAIDVLQTDADREFQARIEELADSGFPAPWDAAPVEEMDLDVTAEFRAVPETPAASRAGDQAHEHLREALWLRSCEAASDEWTDEPTRADRRQEDRR